MKKDDIIKALAELTTEEYRAVLSAARAEKGVVRKSIVCGEYETELYNIFKENGVPKGAFHVYCNNPEGMIYVFADVICGNYKLTESGAIKRNHDILTDKKEYVKVVSEIVDVISRNIKKRGVDATKSGQKIADKV